MKVFLCVEKCTDRILSVGWYETREGAERSIEFFSKDHFVRPLPCPGCGYTDPPRDNPWTRAEVREINWEWA